MNMHNDFNPPEGGDFASMLEESMQEASRRLEPGEKITATIVNTTPEWIFLDIGKKGEGVLDRREVQDADGNLSVQPGSSLEVYFLQQRGSEMRFTTRLGRSSSDGGGNEQLEQAYHSQIPVEGFVEKEIKGGYEVKVAGSTRAFCPYSQMNLRRAADSSVFVGERLAFLISEYAEKGRNIVLTRRPLLEAEENERRASLQSSLQVGQTVRGTVTRILNFGAFVDLGGLEGLVPACASTGSRTSTPSA